MGVDIRTIQTAMTPHESSNLVGDAVTKVYDSITEFERAKKEDKVKVFESKVLPNIDLLTLATLKLKWSILRDFEKKIEDESRSRKREIISNYARTGKLPAIDDSNFIRAKSLMKELSGHFNTDKKRMKLLKVEAKHIGKRCKNVGKNFMSEVYDAIREIQRQSQRPNQRPSKTH